MNTMNKLSTRNGRMTKRAVIRGMALRALSGESSQVHAISYVARRIDESIPTTKSFLRWMAKNEGVELYFSKRSVIFSA